MAPQFQWLDHGAAASDGVAQEGGQITAKPVQTALDAHVELICGWASKPTSVIRS